MSDICTIEDPRSQFVSVSGVTFTFYRVRSAGQDPETGCEGNLCRLTCHDHEGKPVYDFPEEFLKLMRIMFPQGSFSKFFALQKMDEELASQVWHRMDVSRDFQLTWRKGQEGYVEVIDPEHYYTRFNWEAAAAV